MNAGGPTDYDERIAEMDEFDKMAAETGLDAEELRAEAKFYRDRASRMVGLAEDLVKATGDQYVLADSLHRPLGALLSEDMGIDDGEDVDADQAEDFVTELGMALRHLRNVRRIAEAILEEAKARQDAWNHTGAAK